MVVPLARLARPHAILAGALDVLVRSPDRRIRIVMLRRSASLAALVLALACAFVLPRTAHAAAKPAKAAEATAPAVMDSLGFLEKAVARDSSKFDNLYALAVLYMDRERMQEALQVLDKANRLQPKNVKVLVNMGIAADAIGHADVAQDYYTRALAIAPDDSLAGCRMASSKYAQGKYDEAMTMLRELIARNPRSHCAYFTLGVAFADAGIYRDAIRMWKKVVELAPDSPEAVSAKESIDVLEKFLAGK
jgi:tetratricopeptide (TPR) repeat protein